MKELTVPAKTDRLDQVLEFIEDELNKTDCPAKVKMQIKVAVEEIYVNIANYAYPSRGCLRIPSSNLHAPLHVESAPKLVSADAQLPENKDITYSRAGIATIRCQITDDPKQMVIHFIDFGTPYNPLQKEDPDITLSAERRQIGGLGILMVKKIMDHLSYRYVGRKNILTLKKNI